MQNLNEEIEKAKRIAIFSHIAPDADALCSCFALKNIIRNNFDAKIVDVFNDGPIGDLYNQILRDEVINPDSQKKYDIAFVLDCPNLDRIGKCKEIAQKADKIINIDHHETNEKFGDINIVSTSNSSTCEILYVLAKGNKFDINNVIAKQLYQGIITDTNCFRSFSTTRLTHKVVSELLSHKFDARAIKEYYFNNNSIAKAKLLTKALSSLKVYKNDKFTTMKIPYDVFEKLGANFEDTYGIVDNGLNLKDTEACALIIETTPRHFYVSLRSKGNVNVGDIAKKFKGGGSNVLAAYQAKGDIKVIEKRLCDVVEPIISKTEQTDIIF